MSGGHDSAALAAGLRPDAALNIDYGQRPASGEVRASQAICRALDIPFHQVRIDLHSIGSGLLAADTTATELGTEPQENEGVPAPLRSPSPEWWPFRNQLLVSAAAAWALTRGFDTVLTGTVAPDGERHADGTSRFYELLDAVTSYQEGHIRVVAPAIALTTAELVTASGIEDRVLAFAHSCHVSDYACGTCPGCFKHESVLRQLGRLSDDA